MPTPPTTLEAPPTTLDAPLMAAETEALAPEIAPPAAELTDEALALTPLAPLVMAIELEREDRAPPSMELEAEGAEMVDESEPETD